MTGPGGPPHRFDPSVPHLASHDGPVSLVVVADSTAFTDADGPQLPTTEHLYPRVAAATLAAHLDREVHPTVIARPGLTVRDAVRTVTKDQHVQYDVIANADAVVIGVGSFDHAPLGVPPTLELLAAHLRHAGVRRRVRRGLAVAYPWLVRAHGGRRTRTAPSEFDRLYTQLLEHVRGLTWGRVAGVAVGPTSHRARYYGHVHPTHAEREARTLALAEAHGFTGVAAWPQVEPHASALNIDGIHWPAVAHEIVGRTVADALLPALTGTAPTVGLPAAARAALQGR